jgi:hypothetical protein
VVLEQWVADHGDSVHRATPVRASKSVIKDLVAVMAEKDKQFRPFDACDDGLRKADDGSTGGCQAGGRM